MKRADLLSRIVAERANRHAAALARHTKDMPRATLRRSGDHLFGVVS